MASSHVVVIGGGISGLAAAHRLATSRTPLDVTVLEASSQVGGKLATHEVGGLVLDAGAESVLARRPEAVQLIRDVGLGDLLVHPATTGAGVWVGGRLRPLPHQQVLGIPADRADIEASGVLDEAGLAAMDRDERMGPPRVDGDISVGALVRDRMGDQVVDRLVEPLLGGVYAGRADAISTQMALPGLLSAVNQHPTLLSAVQSMRTGATGPVFASVLGGLGLLPGAIVDSCGVAVSTRTRATGLAPGADGWVVQVDSREGSHDLAADAVIMACPGDEAGRLLRSVMEPEADSFGIEYASVVLVTFVFRGSGTLRLPPGTGFLVPPGSGLLLKAATYSSQKWAWIADTDPHAVVVRVSIGRSDDETAWQRSDESLTEESLSELQEILQTTQRPERTRLTRWEHSLPQYRVGHQARVSQLRESLSRQPGLEVCGAGFDGVGIASCIASGQAAATRVAAVLPTGGD